MNWKPTKIVSVCVCFVKLERDLNQNSFELSFNFVDEINNNSNSFKWH